jgi:hypothetical protein
MKNSVDVEAADNHIFALCSYIFCQRTIVTQVHPRSARFSRQRWETKRGNADWEAPLYCRLPITRQQENRNFAQNPTQLQKPGFMRLLKWWPGTELNRRRQPFQGCALPPELPGHISKPVCRLRAARTVHFTLIVGGIADRTKHKFWTRAERHRL